MEHRTKGEGGLGRGITTIITKISLSFNGPVIRIPDPQEGASGKLRVFRRQHWAVDDRHALGLSEASIGPVALREVETHFFSLLASNTQLERHALYLGSFIYPN